MTASTYADRINGITTSEAIKAPVDVATTANITLSGAQTIDGVAVTTGDRVLVRSQTTTTENGIYDVATTAWTRALDFNGTGDAVEGTLVWVRSGDTYANGFFQLTTTDDPIVFGTSAISFAAADVFAAVAAKNAAEAAQAAAEAVLADAGFVAVAADLTGADTIGTVAGIAANVTTVAGVSADVQSVSAQVSGWAFDASTTMADPGAGEVRLNNATLSSVTAIAVDDANSDAVDVSAWVTAWDNTGDAGSHGTLVLRKAGNSAIFGIYTIASLTDNAGWTEVALTHVASNGTFDAADIVLVTVSPHGSAGGGGDVVGPASATDNSLARFDGTSGKLLKDGAAIGTDVQAYDAQLSSLIRQNSQSAAYTTVLTDGGKHILHPTSDNNARTFTIDSNANVAYPIGTAITFVNQINTVTIAITSDTMTLAGAGTTGSRTLAANGIATALKVASTSWIISGSGLT